MKKIIFLMAAAAIIFTACASAPAGNAAQEPAPQYVEQTPTYVVLDHKTKAVGQDVPEWVTRFLDGGVTAVQEMDRYKDKYVFIAEENGTNLNALRQWTSGISVNELISRTLSTRVHGKMVGAAVGSADADFGRYAENVATVITESTFSGARKETDFWLLKRYFKSDGKTTDREVYEFYVLTTMDRDALERQLNEVLDKAEARTAPTAEQKTAIDRVREAFYQDF